MAKTRSFKVKQRPDGTWEASARGLLGVSTIAETAEKAISGHEEVMADFDQFKLHVRGKCGADCRRCRDGHQKGPY